MTPRRAFALVALAALVAACGRSESRCATLPAPTPLDASTTGTLKGTATFQGTPPAMKTLALTSECAARHPAPVPAGDALVRDGRLANVFVYVKEGLGERSFAVPEVPVTIDQRGCLYEPHVAAARTCQPIQFLNSDAFLHNVHGMPARSPAWNFGMGVQGSTRTVRIESPEVMVEVRCDVHPWMRSYLGVLDHPYAAVTGPDGAFTLADVPPGEYVLAAWHERFGRRETRVTLPPRGSAEVEFGFGP